MPTMALVEESYVQDDCEGAREGDEVRVGEGEKVAVEEKDLVEDARSFCKARRADSLGNMVV